MEGVIDAPMRTLLTERGGFSFCVSEFLRVHHQIYPRRVFEAHVPELKQEGKTPSGVPVQVQLLGGNEEQMALNAFKAYEAGARAIDLNFGCPSPVVNRHDGGACLLKYPNRIQAIVSAVRKAVPHPIPVSAKLRLGWECMDDIFMNAERAMQGGASWITIHARTKAQGYTPPAHWEYIGQVRKNLGIPIIANGEIWTLDDFKRCQEITQCQHFMVGRGALANPDLAQQIAMEIGILPQKTEKCFTLIHSPEYWEPILHRFAQITEKSSFSSDYTTCRIKQWLKLAKLKNPLDYWFNALKLCKNSKELFLALRKISENGSKSAFLDFRS